MTKNDYIDRIKFMISGDILETEINDDGFNKIMDIALDELMRYYNSTIYLTVPASSCVDLTEVETSKNVKISAVANVFRAKSFNNASGGVVTDPAYLSMWNAAGYGYGSQRYLYNYLNYSTTQQIANTLSTDLFFQEDLRNRKLYINFSDTQPSEITLEYIPKLEDPSEVVGNFWVDVLQRFALAWTKITLGRIRTRYTQDNALWQQDGEKMLEEGNTELSELRERLQSKTDIIYPID